MKKQKPRSLIQNSYCVVLVLTANQIPCLNIMKFTKRPKWIFLPKALSKQKQSKSNPTCAVYISSLFSHRTRELLPTHHFSASTLISYAIPSLVGRLETFFSNHRQNFFWYSKKKMFKEMFPIKRQQNNGVEVHQQSEEQLMWLQLTSGSLWQWTTNTPSLSPTRNLEMLAECPSVGSEAGRNSISYIAQAHLKNIILCNFFSFLRKDSWFEGTVHHGREAQWRSQF